MSTTQLPKHLIDFACSDHYKWACRLQREHERLKANLALEEKNLRNHKAWQADIEELLAKTKALAQRACSSVADNRVALIEADLEERRRWVETCQRLVNSLRQHLQAFLDNGNPKNSDVLFQLAEFESITEDLRSL